MTPVHPLSLGRRCLQTSAPGFKPEASCGLTPLQSHTFSLRDVQLPAGHRSIETTQVSIAGDTDGQRRLVASL